MQKKILIEGKEISFEANAYTPILYYRIFHKDIMREMESFTEDDSEISIILSNMAALMALQHGKTFSQLSQITVEDIGNFLMGFDDPMCFITNAKEITEVWTDSIQSKVEAKKK